MQNTELSTVTWDYEFLSKYKASSDDELLLITTIKNKLRPNEDKEEKKPKKKPRVRWWDQVQTRPSSAMMFNPKNKARSSLTKYKLGTPVCQMFPPENRSKELEQAYHSQSGGFRASSAKKRKGEENTNVGGDEDA